MPEAPIILRHATAEDIPQILALIHALAAYEREPASTVQATAESLRATLFPPPDATTTTTTTTPRRPPWASVLLALTPTTLETAGMALYFTSYSTWRSAPGIYLEDLFVYERFRGQGFGTALLAALAREVQVIGGKRLEWSVLKWNEPSIKFYESLGAENMGNEWQLMRVTDEALTQLAGRGPAVKWE
ncbi:acyl-CoA N-acyltransferase [Sphaerosporella brunnea]|uniref:Acyl-CoA N-acyltransferase n=1 Tax=Sphaerosporella brunnea TaxID=1250544 RepID=A0A5J5EDF9_9PEZI|nr:acyl-CoA N-acyltransferase [Sphaerosporella brunnea]